MKSIPIVAMFDTIQGEGIRSGVPARFIRVSNCNLGTTICPWCDTADEWTQAGTEYSVASLVQAISTALHNGRAVVITGGEPMLYASAWKEVFTHTTNGPGLISFETNGSIFNSDVEDMIDALTSMTRLRPLFTMSPKTNPKTNKLIFNDVKWLNDYNWWQEMELRGAYRELKMVITSQPAFEQISGWVLQLEKVKNGTLPVTFQPCHPDLTLKDLHLFYDESETAKQLHNLLGEMFFLLPQIHVLAGMQ